jgi:hypothetical protein
MTHLNKPSRVVNIKMGNAETFFDRSNIFWFSDDLNDWINTKDGNGKRKKVSKRINQ